MGKYGKGSINLDILVLASVKIRGELEKAGPYFFISPPLYPPSIYARGNKLES
jgi:hypothetical protein